MYFLVETQLLSPILNMLHLCCRLFCLLYSLCSHSLTTHVCIPSPPPHPGMLPSPAFLVSQAFECSRRVDIEECERMGALGMAHYSSPAILRVRISWYTALSVFWSSHPQRCRVISARAWPGWTLVFSSTVTTVAAEVIFLKKKDLCMHFMYMSLHVHLHTRKGHWIPIHMVVSHPVVLGN